MAAIVRTEDNIATARDQVYISDIPLCRPVHVWRDEPVVEDDNRPACRWLFAIGNGHQRVDFESLGKIGYVETPVIDSGVQLILDHDITARIFPGAHRLDLKRVLRRGRCGG